MKIVVSHLSLVAGMEYDMMRKGKYVISEIVSSERPKVAAFH